MECHKYVFMISCFTAHLYKKEECYFDAISDYNTFNLPVAIYVRFLCYNIKFILHLLVE